MFRALLGYLRSPRSKLKMGLSDNPQAKLFVALSGPVLMTSGYRLFEDYPGIWMRALGLAMLATGLTESLCVLAWLARPVRHSAPNPPQDSH